MRLPVSPHLPGTPGGAPLSKAQKQFNRLIERIQEQRDALTRWQDYIPKYQARVAAELEPLQERCDQAHFALAKVFDAAHGSAGFTKRERAKLAMLISDTCAELLLDGEEEDAQIVALHDRYSDTSHAELKDEETELFKGMAETIFGVELDDHEAAGSPEEVREALHRKMAQQREAQPEPRHRRAASRRRRRRKRRSWRRRRKPRRNRCARSFASSPVRCTRTAKPMRWSATARRR